MDFGGFTLLRDEFKNTRLFFVTGCGRSGTKFLSKLLCTIPDVYVSHESIGDSKKFWYNVHNPHTSEMMFSKFRRLLMQRRIESSGCKVYGEVNSFLRNFMEEIVWTNVVHLVRNGKDVVRSIMNRYSPRLAAVGRKLTPEWRRMTPLQHACWIWTDAVEKVDSFSIPVVKMEDIIISYEVLCTQVTQPLDLPSVRESEWAMRAHRIVNPSSSYTFPSWDSWTRDEKSVFKEMCGGTMERFGYEV